MQRFCARQFSLAVYAYGQIAERGAAKDGCEGLEGSRYLGHGLHAVPETRFTDTGGEPCSTVTERE
jgi:hypothetical protein